MQRRSFMQLLAAMAAVIAHPSLAMAATAPESAPHHGAPVFDQPGVGIFVGDRDEWVQLRHAVSVEGSADELTIKAYLDPDCRAYQVMHENILDGDESIPLRVSLANEHMETKAVVVEFSYEDALDHDVMVEFRLKLVDAITASPISVAA